MSWMKYSGRSYPLLTAVTNCIEPTIIPRDLIISPT